MKKSDGTHIVGIDLGTTFSLVATFEHGRPVVIPNALGEPLTPSAVSVLEDGSVLVGAAARALAMRSPERTATAFKRDMGTLRSHALGGQQFSPVELSALVLASLKADAEAALGGTVSEAVITVPAYFGDAQRQATRDAARVAGLIADRIINEPTAAALAYGFQRRQHESLVAVVDLGGGTFDVTVLRLTSGIVEILASSGDTRLGGEDFTEAIAHLALAAAERDGVGARADRLEIWPLLVETAEVLKRRISDEASVEATLELPGQSTPWTFRLTRQEADQAWRDLIARMKGPLDQALSDAKLAVAAIDEVLLVGGATRMPCVRELAELFFGRAPLDQLPVDEAVALGAAVQAALKIGDGSVDDLVATDIAPFSLGISAMIEVRGGMTSGVFSPILERGTVLPASRKKRFFTLHPGQTEIRIDVYQGEHSIAADNTFLGRTEISELPAGRINAIEVRFSYDLNGILEVETTALATDKKSVVVMNQRPNALSTAQIEEACARFARLKIHPRELLPNRTLVERGETLHQRLLGGARASVSVGLAGFRQALEDGDPAGIERERRALTALLASLANA